MKKRYAVVFFSYLLLLALFMTGCDTPAERQYDLGKQAMDEDNPEKAIAAFEKAIEIDPSFYRPYSRLADIYIDKEQYDKAEEVLTEGLKNCPDAGRLYRRLSKVYRLQKEFTKARAICNEALANPAIKRDKDEVADIEKEMSRITEAEKGNENEVQEKNADTDED